MTVAIIILVTCVFLILCRVFVNYQRSCADLVLEPFSTYVPRGATVLDLGSGSGCISLALKQRGYKVTPADIVMKGTCMKPEVILQDGKPLPFPDNSFDVCICAFMLHHARTQMDILKEIKRVCRIAFVYEDTPSTDIQWKYAQKHAQSDWGHGYFHDTDAWKKIFRKHGFRLLQCVPMGNLTCPFARKPWYYPVDKTLYILDCAKP
jgi:SAM-dependent methyltransferase